MKKNETAAQVTRIVVVMVTLVALGIGVFLFVYNRYNDQMLYAERLSQMQDVTTQLFSGLENVVENEWNTADILRNYIEMAQPATADDLQRFMGKQAVLNKFDENMDSLLAIDQNGRYYTQDGMKGTLQEVDYLLDGRERVTFVSNTVTTNRTKMVFLEKLRSPVRLEDGSTIIYYGMAQDMTELEPYFKCEAYENDSSVYVIDSDGLKLFSGRNDNTLLNGYNVYKVLKSMEYHHGSNFEETEKNLEENGLAYSNAVLDGEEYFYSMYQMENAEWVLVFLVRSDAVALNTVELVNTTIKIVMVFAVFMCCVSGMIIFWLLQRQQKKELQIVESNNEKLEKLNVELEAASKAKSDFLSNMSHDIRTPMNAIVGITGLMEHESGMSDKMRGYIDKVQLSSRHLLGLINDILDMSRIESQKVTLNAENVSLAEEIGQIDSMIRTQATEHHQNFQIHGNRVTHEYLICDGVRLRQILLNLLSNAVKYTPDGGAVTLDFTEVPCEIPDHAKFIFAVTDNGYGMTPQFLQHIFEPFTRAENSVTNKVQGTGLGMAITKNIVDLMKGEIQVESEPGKGSRFEVTLTFPIDRKKECALRGARVLLLSKDPVLTENVRASMREAPVKFHAAETLQEAEEWLGQKKADVLLLSGCAENAALKENIDFLRTHLPKKALILCVDDIREEQIRDQILAAGADGIVASPFFLSNLEMAVARTRTNTSSDQENTSILCGMRFLCAEDNELNAEILKEILHMYDAECTIYSNGEEITEAFQTVKPGDYNAVLMDIQMPKMNGLDAAKAIRNGSNPLGKTIPIIAMTANAFSEDVEHCLEAGMDAHIAKPLDIAVLEKTLRGFAGRDGRN